MKVDVMLLADAFERFRSVFFDGFGIDPARCYTLPNAAYKAMLHKTGATFDLITDPDMAEMVHSNLRGGLCQVMCRRATANNIYMDGGIDPARDPSTILYLDKNALYAHVLKKFLPIGDFKFEKNPESIDLDGLPVEGERGYLFEVDLRLPEEFHDKLSELPMVSETKTPPGSKNKLLIQDFEDKKHYVCHFALLQFLKKHGWEITRVHRVISFHQSQIIKGFIDYCVEKRTESHSKYEKDLWKLICNSIFGKTMENKTKRKDVRLVGNWETVGRRKGLDYFSCIPTLCDITMFDENLAAVHLKKSKIILDTPSAIGLSVLDLSKLVMYEFVYDFLHVHYPNLVTPCYTDTDSLILDVKMEDGYDIIREHPDEFDTSNFGINNPMNIIPRHQGISGLMKVETASIPVRKYVGLRAKTYMLQLADDSCIKRAKGIKKGVLHSQVHLAQYETALAGQYLPPLDQTFFRNYQHEMYTIRQTKRNISGDDTKRFICPDGKHTLAWGHYKIPIIRAEEEARDDMDRRDERPVRYL